MQDVVTDCSFIYRFILLALCLIAAPRLLLFVSETASHTDISTTLTPLESFIAIEFGFFLFALYIALIFNVCFTVMVRFLC